ncbi:ExbD/TolR family protein [Spirulina major]|uniref:ExbD/TolR family protein n=1 Tax=Spirulina major TaxID=270636 RepID=UPI000934F4D8|nr:biopolymer transporter ExbD [Spirulina major]
MRFRARRDPEIPTIDLTPMLNVMMAVLAFFVAIAMTLGDSPAGVEVTLPDTEADRPVEPNSDRTLIISLDTADQATVNGQPLTPAATIATVAQYLTAQPDDAVVLLAAPTVAYDDVIRWLVVLREQGGDRVTLGIPSPPTPSNDR